MADLILVNINPAYQVSELQYALNKVKIIIINTIFKVGCRALVCVSKFRSSNYIEMLKTIAPEISLSHVGELKSPALPDLKSK